MIPSDEQIAEYISENIAKFHEKRLESLSGLKLKDLLKRKNPYLFRSKNLLVASELIKTLLDAHLSSQEEGLFGNFLEGLAIYVAGIAHNGKKSGIEGIDLEFDKDGVRYIVSIKSGPNWGNSSQIKKMEDYFTRAKKIIRQGNTSQTVEAVNGCCYGRDNKPEKGNYKKLCGQEFWSLISGDESFYQRIIRPLGDQAKVNNDNFNNLYQEHIKQLETEFIGEFCNSDGEIDWEKLVAFNSGK